jgi:hypothetical protein
MILFTIQGQQKLQSIVDKIPFSFDTTPVLDEAAAVLYNRMRTRFLQQVDPAGIPWLPAFAAKKTGRNTLFKTGKLFHSLQLYADSPDSRAIGSNVTSSKGFPYGMAHQYGWGKLPPRVFLGFSVSQDVPWVLQLVQKRLEEAFHVSS